MFVHVICGEVEHEEEAYDKNELCIICNKDMYKKNQHNEAQKKKKQA